MRGLLRIGLFFVTIFIALGTPSPTSADSPRTAVWPDLSKVGSRAGGGENDAALLVAVENYAHVGKVAGAKQNLADWKHWLVDVRGVPDSSVFELVDDKVTPASILKKARAAAMGAKAGGTVWFLFVGHGVAAKNGGDAMLVTVDARGSDEVYKDVVGRQAILAELEKGSQSRTVFVADSCFSGGKDHGGREFVRGGQPLVALKDAEVHKDVIVFSAGKADQFAGPLPGTQRPAYSYLLLGGLMGWADGEADGKRDSKVSVFEANHFVVRALAMQDERDQEPEFVPAQARDVVLATGATALGPNLKQAMATAAPDDSQPEAGRRAAPEIKCPAGTAFENGHCVEQLASCPPGSRRVDGQCQAGRAVPGAAEEAPRSEPGRHEATIDTTVIDVQASGNFSVIKLDAGENRGVKKGMSGTIPDVAGARFSVTEVYPCYVARQKSQRRHSVARSVTRTPA